MLTIRHDQLTALADDFLRRFVSRLRRDLASRWPQAGDVAVEVSIEAARSEAPLVGLANYPHILRYAAFVLEHGAGTAAHAVALNALRDRAGTADEKAAALDDLASELAGSGRP